MYAEPSGLDPRELERILSTRWRVDVADLRYEPVGFGTHHYVATDAKGVRWWVNVDDLPTKSWLGPNADDAFAELERCLATAVALRELGLEFVHAPCRCDTDDVLVRLSERFGVSVYAFIDGRSSDYGEHSSDAERLLVLAALARMHSTNKQLLPAVPRRDALEIPWRSSFLASLDDLGSPWGGGPFAEPARALLRDSVAKVHALFDRYDTLAQMLREDDRPWVVTHGEPHAANVIWTSDDTFLLIDWDTVAVGPPERDLWMVDNGGADVNATAIELFELWWRLSEITGYTDVFRRPHIEDANTRLAWKGLCAYLS